VPDVVERLAEVCKPVLETTARRRRTMTYGQLARRVRLKANLPDLGPRDRILHDALDILSVESYDGGQNILLSVVVVREDTGMRGPGFFHLAQERLGAYSREVTWEEIFSAELTKVLEHYRR
jgi:hypothetical protein